MLPARLPRPLVVGADRAQPDHRDVRDREREHRAERVHRREEGRLARDDRQRRDAGEDEDRDVGRLEARVDLANGLGELAVLAHREREPREADQGGIGRDQEDHRREDPDVDLEDLGRHGTEPEVRHDSQHRVVGELRAEVRRVLAVHLPHGHRGKRDHRQQRVEADDRQDDQLDGARNRHRGLLGLLGHVRDRLDPRVGDHPDGDPEREVAPGRRDAEVDLAHQQVGVEHEDDPDPDEDDLRREVGDREHEIEPRRLLGALDVERREQRDESDPEDHVGGALPERLPEHREVVGHEEGRDRDRDDVGEHLAPGREEAHDLVEGVAREARRAAGLRVHDRRLRVGRGGEGEDQPRDHERDRGEAERVERDDAERVVDRRADVAVRGREQRSGAVHPAQVLFAWMSFGHRELAGPRPRLEYRRRAGRRGCD